MFQVLAVEPDGTLRKTPARMIDAVDAGMSEQNAKTLFALEPSAKRLAGTAGKTDVVVHVDGSKPIAVVARDIARRLGPTAQVNTSWRPMRMALRREQSMYEAALAVVWIGNLLGLALVFVLLGWRHREESRKIRSVRLGLGVAVAGIIAAASTIAVTAGGALLMRVPMPQLHMKSAAAMGGSIDFHYALAHTALMLGLIVVSAIPGLALAARR